MFFYILYNFDFILNIFLVIYDKLLLLNMEIIFNTFAFSFNINEFINNFNIMSSNISFIDNKWFLNENGYNNIEELDKVWYESFNFIDIINCFFYSFYTWLFIPLLLCIGLIYFLHSIGGLYSAYVDYFQKNPDHFNSFRAFIPAFFFFFFLVFSVFSLIVFTEIQYLKYFLWFLFI